MGLIWIRRQNQECSFLLHQFRRSDISILMTTEQKIMNLTILHYTKTDHINHSLWVACAISFWHFSYRLMPKKVQTLYEVNLSKNKDYMNVRHFVARGRLWLRGFKLQRYCSLMFMITWRAKYHYHFFDC